MFPDHTRIIGRWLEYGRTRRIIFGFGKGIAQQEHFTIHFATQFAFRIVRFDRVLFIRKFRKRESRRIWFLFDRETKEFPIGFENLAQFQFGGLIIEPTNVKCALFNRTGISHRDLKK